MSEHNSLQSHRIGSLSDPVHLRELERHHSIKTTASTGLTSVAGADNGSKSYCHSTPMIYGILVVLTEPEKGAISDDSEGQGPYI